MLLLSTEATPDGPEGDLRIGNSAISRPDFQMPKPGPRSHLMQWQGGGGAWARKLLPRQLVDALQVPREWQVLCRHGFAGRRATGRTEVYVPWALRLRLAQARRLRHVSAHSCLARYLYVDACPFFLWVALGRARAWPAIVSSPTLSRGSTSEVACKRTVLYRICAAAAWLLHDVRTRQGIATHIPCSSILFGLPRLFA